MQILTRSFRAILAAAALALLPAALAAQDIAIRNATLITITGGDIENGTIVVRNGKISAVGRNVTFRPASAPSTAPASSSCQGSSTHTRMPRSRTASTRAASR